jgi:pilus assembly protein CpaC
MSSPSHALTMARLAVATSLALQALGAATQATAATAPKHPPAAAVRNAPLPVTGLCSRVDIAPMVQIPVGKSTVLRPTSPVTRILLGNPENARAARPAETDGKKEDGGSKASAGADTRPGVADVDVLLLAPTEVYLLGKTIGSTNVVMLDRTGTCTAFDVVVGMDTTALQSVLGQLLPGEKSIKVSSAFDSIVLSGVVTDSEALVRVTDLANAYVRGGGDAGKGNPRVVNMLEIGAPQQVMLEVKVAEVSKALIDKLGVQFSGSRTNGNWTYSLLADFLSNGNAVASAARSAINTLGVTLDAQKDDGLVKILAEPTIMAISGQTGSFLAGGKIFIPVSQDTTTGGRTITLEEKEFGVSVKFTPTVLGNGRINLRVRPEVSELNRDGIGIVAVSGTSILPSFTSRKAETTVQLMDGQSFAIGGLIKNNTTTNIKAMPFLGELPVVGALFRSTEFQADRTELVFVITPRLVKPLPADYRLPTDDLVDPSRTDLMLRGKLEGSRSDSPPGAKRPADGGFEKEKK